MGRCVTMQRPSPKQTKRRDAPALRLLFFKRKVTFTLPVFDDRVAVVPAAFESIESALGGVCIVPHNKRGGG